MEFAFDLLYTLLLNSLHLCIATPILVKSWQCWHAAAVLRRQLKFPPLKNKSMEETQKLPIRLSLARHLSGRWPLNSLWLYLRKMWDPDQWLAESRLANTSSLSGKTGTVIDSSLTRSRIMACAQHSTKVQLLLSTWLLLMTEGWLAAALAKRLDSFIHSVPVNVDLISTLRTLKLLWFLIGL